MEKSCLNGERATLGEPMLHTFLYNNEEKPIHEKFKLGLAGSKGGVTLQKRITFFLVNTGSLTQCNSIISIIKSFFFYIAQVRYVYIIIMFTFELHKSDMKNR